MGIFSHFLHCTNGTKLCKASQFIRQSFEKVKGWKINLEGNFKGIQGVYGEDLTKTMLVSAL